MWAARLRMILLLLAYNNDIGSIINREDHRGGTAPVGGGKHRHFAHSAVHCGGDCAGPAVVPEAAAQRQREEEAAAGEQPSPSRCPEPEACAEADPAVPEEPEEDIPEPEAPRTVEELWREYQKKGK